ncbi:MAG: kinase, partial [Spirochaetaceae bacterium]
HKFRIVYSMIENVKSVDEIVHPSVRETLRYMNISQGLEIHHDGDIPARSGMGSSSAFTVGLLKILYALNGRIISKKQLYEQAIHIEQTLIRENVGSQDQVWAACGGLNTIEFLQNGEIIVEPIIMQDSARGMFEKKFMLIYTGLARNASDIACEQINNTQKNKELLCRMKEFADEAQEILVSKSGDFVQFGRLLHESWKLKKCLSNKITNPEIEAIYDAAVKNGAIGGKVLGAGGGGFMLFYVEPEYQNKVKDALSDYLHVPFKFTYTGSEIIVYNPDFFN